MKINSVKSMVVVAHCSAIILVSKFALSFLPNVQVVTFLLMFFTITLGLKKSLAIAIIYTILEIQLWRLSEQFYIWTLIVVVTAMFKPLFKDNFIWWSLLAAFFGITFGLLCAIPFMFVSGFYGAVAYYIAGIPFDVIHMVFNYIFMISIGPMLYRPFLRVVDESQLRREI